MEENSFLEYIRCNYTIRTYDQDCHIITKELNIEPNRCFNKGDKFTSKFSPRIGSKPYGLWEIQSIKKINKRKQFSDHLNYFQKLLGNKVETIKKFQNYYKFDCVFTVYIETDDAGYSFDLYKNELDFINKISTRFSCFILVKESKK